MNDALVLNNLFKAFGQKIAVDHLSMVVPRGSMFGLVGPNGAGKTTTLSMTTGLLRPDEGTASVLGHDVWTDPVRAKALMGVLPDGVRLFDRLSGRELLTFTGQMRGLDPETTKRHGDSLLDALGLAQDHNTLVCDYSQGMTKKISLACALIHAPKLVLLDEPLEAVDPVSGQAIRDMLKAYTRGGGTVVLSSHVMELVENMCDHVAVIDHGRIIAQGTVDEVRGGQSLQQRFVELVGRMTPSDGGEGLAWLERSSN